MTKRPEIIPPDVYTRFLTYWREAQAHVTAMRKGFLPLGLVATAYNHMTPYQLAISFKSGAEVDG